MPAQGRKNVHGKTGVRFKAAYTKSKYENMLRNVVTDLIIHDSVKVTEAIPKIGLVHVKDAETGAARWINTGSRKVRAAYSEWFQNATSSADRLMIRYSVDHVDIATDDDYVRPLMTLFHGR